MWPLNASDCQHLRSYINNTVFLYDLLVVSSLLWGKWEEQACGVITILLDDGCTFNGLEQKC